MSVQPSARIPDAAAARARRAGVLISYARSDGAEIAQALRQRLGAAGIEVWHDLSDLQGGDPWWAQIREALARVEFVVLVLTDGALRSAVVQRECQYARQQGVHVFPVVPDDAAPTEPQPRWLRASHHYLLDAQQPRLLADLRRAPPARRVPFMVEDLPDDFVARGEEYERLVALLTEPLRHDPVAITAALRGAGGYGKTTLARAVCHDTRVQNAFGDGVLWVTLGESPTRADLIDRVVDLVEILDGERPGFASLDAATTRLRECWADRDLLLVIDDVWNIEHLRPFLSGGAQCARLVTTRNSDALPGDAAQVPVDQMRASEAVHLLSHGLASADARAMRQLAARLCEWPLLLKLANGALHRRVREGGETTAAALSWMHRALDKRGVVAFDARNAAERNRAVALTLRVSLDELTVDEAERFFDLAVFAEDLDVPLDVLTRYWALCGGLDADDAEDLCVRLSAVSLVQRLDLRERSLRLHDSVRHFLCADQGPQALARRHGELLAALAGESAPHRAALTDGYLMRHLAHHLEGAGRLAELALAVKSLAYAAARLHRHKSWSLQEDILRALVAQPQDAELVALAGDLARGSDMLDRLVDAGELEQTLRARLAPLLGPGTIGDPVAGPFLRADKPLPTAHRDLVRTFRLDQEVLRCAAFGPGGDWLLCGSASGRSWVFDVRSGRTRACFDGQRARINGCAVAPDGRWVATASEDGQLAVWDPETGSASNTLRAAPARLLCCAVHPAGSHVAAGCGDDRLRVWRLDSGDVQWVLGGHLASVTACAFDADGRWLASASADGHFAVWDTASGVCRWRVRAHVLPLTCCAFDGDRLLTGSVDGSVSVWDLASGARLHELRGHKGAVRGCVALPGGGWLVTAGDDATTRIWRADTGQLHHVMRAPGGAIRALACDLQAAHGATVGSDGNAQLWWLQLDAERPHPAMAAEAGASVILAVGPAGKRFVAREADGAIKLWQGPDWDEPRELWQDGPSPEPRRASNSPWRELLFSDDDAHLVGVTESDEAWLWSVVHDAPAQRLRDLTGSIGSFAFTRDGLQLVVEAREESPPYRWEMQVWDVWQERLLRRVPLADALDDARVGDHAAWVAVSLGAGRTALLDGWTGARLATVGLAEDRVLPPDGLVPGRHQGAIARCAFSADGCSLVSAGDDGACIVWDLHTGLRAQTVAVQPHWVWGCDFDQRAGGVFTASWDGAVKQWNTGDGELVRSFEARQGPVLDLAVDRAGGRLVTASPDGCIDLWDASSGELLRRMRSDQPASCCAIDSAADRIAAGNTEGGLTVWDAHTGEPVARIEAHAAQVNRCLFDAGGNRLVSVGDDGCATVRDARGLALQWRLQVAPHAVVDAALTADGSRLATLDWSPALTLWNLESGAREGRLDLACWPGFATACAWSPDGGYIAVAQGTRLRILRSADLACERELPAGTAVEVLHVLPQATQLGVGGLPFWTDHDAGRRPEYPPTSARPFLRSADRRHTLRFRIEAAEPVIYLYPDEGEPFDLRLDDTVAGQPVALASSNGKSFRDEGRGRCTDASLDPGGRHAAFVFADGVLRVCDIVGRTWAAVIHTGDELRQCAWLEDGRRLVLGGSLGLYWLSWSGR